MPAKALRTHPFDVVVAIRLLRNADTLAALAEQLAAAPSQVHAAIGRLTDAGLLKAESRATNPRALLEFLSSGVRYAFPVHRGRLAEGIPTAYSAGPLAATVDPVDVVVWPAATAKGAMRGFSITPLYPRAAQLPERDPVTYQLLTVVDALRLGDPKVRPHARAALESLISR